MNTSASSCAGATKHEVLIVTSILLAMAALVGPQLTNAAANRREAVLADQLRYLRTQILIYRVHHEGRSPGYPDGSLAAEPSFETFVAQMTLFTDVQGRTSSTFSESFHFGPYLQKIPANPYNKSDHIRFIAESETFPHQAVDGPGWLYKPATCSIAANVPGEDANGVPLIDY